MKLFERIGRKTPKKNKVIGITTTLLATASLVVAESGLVDNRPILKMGLELLSAKLGAISVYQAQKVEENDK
jgi:hypothetical protein